jgi:hypothetical protein
MATLHSPISVGSASKNAAHAADLGKIVFVDGKIYVVAKASAAIAAAAKKGVATTFVSGRPTWLVDLPADPVGEGFGIIPSGQTGSDGSTGLLSGDYFMLQISGPFTGLSGVTLLKSSATAPGIQVNSLGRVLAFAKVTSITVSLLQTIRNTGYITNTAVASVGDDMTGVLTGLV